MQLLAHAMAPAPPARNPAAPTSWPPEPRALCAERLQRLGALLADGTLRVHVQATYELAQALEALGALAGQHTQGKLTIEVR